MLRAGIVGLPNVGKSTLFNAVVANAKAQAANFPFCTIEPNVGIVSVPDTRLQVLADISVSKEIVPARVEFVDIAGLVKGASQGEGLGNQFLANIRETDAIAHVVRCFDDPNVIHVDGAVNPESDIEVINTELALADLEAVEKAILRYSKAAKGQDKDAIKMKAICEKVLPHLNDALPLRAFELNEDDAQLLGSLSLMTLKPTMYIANVEEDGLENNPLLDKVAAIAASENAVVVPVCNKLEAEIAELEDDEKTEFLADIGMEEPGLNRVIRAGYDLLGLHTYFTAGVKEVRAWTIPLGATAPQSAGKIHTDFEKGFIRAEVIAYSDYVEFKGESGAKDAGKWRLEGKDYIVKDGDVIHFRFNV